MTLRCKRYLRTILTIKQIQFLPINLYNLIMKKIYFSSVLFNIKTISLLFLFFTLSTVNLFAGKKSSGVEIMVSNQSELNAAFSSAKPGQVIVMKDGDWKNVKIDFNANANSSAPITLKAQTPGKVIISGVSTLTFSKPFLIVDGLFFKEGHSDLNAVVNFNSDNCQFLNSALLNYNPESVETNYYWVFFKGNYNRMSHCFFKGKNNMQPMIGNDQDNSRHNSVDHCYIKDIPYMDKNGREIFRIWGYGRSEELGEDGAFFTIEYNLFEHADGEGEEIISFKSNRNIARFNTIRASKGGLIGRSGNYNTFEGNLILGENIEGTNGIRIAGQNHRVINNYISDISGDGLILITGEYIDTYLTKSYIPVPRAGTALGRVPRYGPVKNGLFSNNSFVNTGGAGINIGYKYKFKLGERQMLILPENNSIVNNLIVNCKNGPITLAVQDKNPPFDFLKFSPNLFEANAVSGSKVVADSLSAGFSAIDPKLVLSKDGFVTLVKSNPEMNVGTSSNLKSDLGAKFLDKINDAGADVNPESKTALHPLLPNEVGPQWVVEMRKSGVVM